MSVGCVLVWWTVKCCDLQALCIHGFLNITPQSYQIYQYDDSDASLFKFTELYVNVLQSGFGFEYQMLYKDNREHKSNE